LAARDGRTLTNGDSIFSLILSLEQTRIKYIASYEQKQCKRLNGNVFAQLSPSEFSVIHFDESRLGYKVAEEQGGSNETSLGG
jgi:hypothetical protein